MSQKNKIFSLDISLLKMKSLKNSFLQVNKLLIAVLLFYINYALVAQVQYFSFEHFKISDGLSNNSINAVLQTKDGFIWIATKDGLNRFNGQNFVIFKHDQTSVKSIPENYVMSLFESRDGTFWVGTWGGGLCKYDPVHESFIKIKTNLANDNYVQCISEDKNGSLWFGTLNGGLFKYSPQSKQTINYNTETGGSLKITNNNITSLVLNEDNTLWIGTWGNGFSYFDEQNKIVKNFTHGANKNSLSNNNVWFLQNDQNNKLLISSDYGVDLYDPEKDLFTHNLNVENKFQRFINYPIRQTFRDSYNRLWIGSYEYQGLFMIEKDQKGETQVHRILKEEDDPQSLTMNRIRWIYEDRKRNIWIGTEDGLNKLPALKPFVHFRYFPMRKISLGGRVVSGIIEGKDSILWVGFNGAGFDKIDLRKNIIRHFNHNPNNLNSLSEDDVTSIFLDRFGKMWIGTTHSGLNSFNTKTNSFKHFAFDSPNADRNWIQQILETKDGTLLIGTNAGLDIFNRSSETFSVFNPHVNGKNIFPKNFSTNALFEDREENLWVGTWLDGLFRYDKKTQTFYHYMPDYKNPHSISANKITCIMEDSHGFIWLGTLNGGVNKFDKSTGKFYHYSAKQGLPNDVVFGILEDAKGFLWISTLNGLAKFDPIKEKFRNYDVSDGIIHNQFNWHASYKSKSGLMYFGTVNGFMSFHPDSVKIDPSAPSIALTSFKVFGKETTLPQSLPATKEILLDYNQNFFSIEFAALDIAPNHKHNFAYLLEGVDPDWVLSGLRSIVFYTGVAPGRYKFFVKACNADGVWSLPLSLSIIISPAWWMTWWFKVIVGIILLTLGYLVYLYRLRQILKIQKIRLNIANDLHDEIGSNLSSISVDSQMLLSNGSLDETQQELASFISKTAKETVETMRDIIWFINPNNDFGKDMIFKMRETAAKLLAGIKWSFQVSSDVTLEEFNLEIRRNIYLIYKEALNNIVRHSNSQSCEIELRKLDNALLLMIKDDGKGFNERKVQENNGLRSIKRRAENINAVVKINSEIGKGTVVNLSVPFGIHK
jgi:ligand-binding sensor domain-containing protein